MTLFHFRCILLNKRMYALVSERRHPMNSEGNITDSDLLIIEDSQTQADYLRLMLEKHNFRVRVARNGGEALTMLEESKPEIIITDVMMPDMDGYALCRKIKGEERFKDIPVIILTSLSDPHDVIKGLESGADNFVTKPCDEEYLPTGGRFLIFFYPLMRRPIIKISNCAKPRMNCASLTQGLKSPTRNWRLPIRSWKLSDTRSPMTCASPCKSSAGTARQ